MPEDGRTQSAMRAVKRGSKSATSSVEVSEHDGLRLLHLGGDAIQSAVRLADPDALELHYTRAMMGVLLFVDAPRDFLMIGLGGGSIARFVHGRLPQARFVAVEINPQVVSAARMLFALPEDDDRLQVVVDDGAQYVPRHPLACDVLLLDAFEDGVAVASTCSARFYDACYAAIRDGGVLAQNFMADDRRTPLYIERLREAFDGRVLEMPSGDRVNRIAFGLKWNVRRIPLAPLRQRAARLQRRLRLPYGAMVRDLAESNERNAGFLRLRASED